MLAWQRFSYFANFLLVDHDASNGLIRHADVLFLQIFLGVFLWEMLFSSDLEMFLIAQLPMARLFINTSGKFQVMDLL